VVRKGQLGNGLFENGELTTRHVFTFLFCEYIDTADKTDRVALLSEIQMLKRAGRHPNIVNLVGACTQGGKLPGNHHMTMNCPYFSP